MLPTMRHRRLLLGAMLGCTLTLAPSFVMLSPLPAAASSRDAGAGPASRRSALPSDAAGAAVAGEDWAWPLSPQPDVVGAFNPPERPYGPGHVGVDLLGWAGQPVTAVAAGTVSFAGQVAGTPVVVVVHGGERSTYQPVEATVHRGDTVAGGALLGTLSNVSGHCLPLSCLHLGRRAGDVYLDPLDLLAGGSVRLLPRTDGMSGQAIRAYPPLPHALTSSSPLLAVRARPHALARGTRRSAAASLASAMRTSLLVGAAKGLAICLKHGRTRQGNRVDFPE
jgi:hypothetical protein